ncbi:MAG TPA: ribonuclease T [Steroidobacteraceae bacterium]|nr:ribonuclease T [Steroidobacteraceae bacterium]
MNNDQGTGRMARRFRGFLPVVVDVETGGFNCQRDALLQIAAVMIDLDDAGRLVRGATHSYHVKPFEGANIEAASLQVNKIDPWHPLRPALEEREVLQRIFREVRAGMQSAGCKRAILVGHNAWFDLSFLNAAVERSGVKRCPFHPFSSFDTATLAGAAFGQTVLAKAATIAGLGWDTNSAHSATYDAERTAELFCTICNELAGSFQWAENRARTLGWHESTTAVPDGEADAVDEL